MSSEKPPRYRLDGERACIELKLRTLQQLFDGRDPAPFRERDLDEDAVEYIVDAAEEIAPKVGLKLVVWISERSEHQQLEDTTIVEAIRGHFTYEIARLRRQIREHVRLGQMALLVGLAVLVVFLTLAKLALSLSLGSGHVGPILREGLVITGWVAMWRPLELLLYGWWPLVRKRRLFMRILLSEIAIVHGHGSDEPLRFAAATNAMERIGP